jgi:3-oxoadipate enol-lactonase
MSFTRASDGVRLHYEVFGRRDGEPVLLIQGLGTDKNAWNLQRMALARRYRTIALDNRGAGRSDKPKGPYTLEQMADDAMQVLDAAGIESAHVVGASMGGAISQIVAMTYPHRVRSLVLACTACRNHPWRRELLDSWRETADSEGMAALASTAARWVMAPRSMRRISPTLGWLGPLGLIRPPDGFVAQAEALLASDDIHSADLLETITAPTLVVVGNQDVLTPRGDSEEIAERIPGAELVVISGAAHGLMIEHWRAFNGVLLEFLDRVTAQSAIRATETTTGGV